ncbi:hypothetical protein pb186bvf_014583 [Paramecium bursaria]
MQNQGQSRALKNTFSTLTGNQQAFSNHAYGEGAIKALDSLPMDYKDYNMSQLNYFSNFQISLPSINMATMIQQQFLPINDLYSQENYTKFAFRGMRADCEIVKLLLNNYYPIKEQIFNKCNSNSAKRMDTTNNKIDWFKGRIRYQFKDGIARGILFILESVNNIYQGKQEAQEKMKIDINLNDPELGDLIKLEKHMEKKSKPDPYLNIQDIIQVISRLVEQLFEKYHELRERNEKELDHDKNIAQLLYIDGFKYAEIEKVNKISKLVQKKIDTRVTLVQDFGTLKKQVDPHEHENDQSRQLMKDVDMHINSIMFEIDKLEQLRQRLSRFQRMQSQPNLSKDVPSQDPFYQTNNQFAFNSTQTSGKKEFQSSYHFYKSQKDSQIQQNSQKWITKQFQISQKQLDDEVKFIQFRNEIQEKQVKAEQNLDEYRSWQQMQLEKQEKLNQDRLQLHKERMNRDAVEKLKKIEEKVQIKEENLKHQKQLLQDYQDQIKKEKQEHFERIKQKSLQANMSKSQMNLEQQQVVNQKEEIILKKQRYIEEMKAWNQNYLRQQADKKQLKTQKAHDIVEQKEEQKRKEFEEREQKHKQYKQKYDALYNDYHKGIIHNNKTKQYNFLIKKQFLDVSQEEFTRFQFSLRAQSEQQAQRLKDRRIRVQQEEMAGENMLKRLEIKNRQKAVGRGIRKKETRINIP